MKYPVGLKTLLIHCQSTKSQKERAHARYRWTTGNRRYLVEPPRSLVSQGSCVWSIRSGFEDLSALWAPDRLGRHGVRLKP